MELVENYIKNGTVTPIWVAHHHKAKLYEMSKAILKNKAKFANIYVQEKSIKYPKQEENEFGYHTFDWFELCTTHLSFYIMADPVEYFVYCAKYSMLEDKRQMEHPIDYLYSEFSNIKELYYK